MAKARLSDPFTQRVAYCAGRRCLGGAQDAVWVREEARVAKKARRELKNALGNNREMEPGPKALYGPWVAHVLRNIINHWARGQFYTIKEKGAVRGQVTRDEPLTASSQLTLHAVASCHHQYHREDTHMLALSSTA